MREKNPHSRKKSHVGFKDGPYAIVSQNTDVVITITSHSIMLELLINSAMLIAKKGLLKNFGFCLY